MGGGRWQILGNPGWEYIYGHQDNAFNCIWVELINTAGWMSDCPISHRETFTFIIHTGGLYVKNKINHPCHNLVARGITNSHSDGCLDIGL